MSIIGKLTKKFKINGVLVYSHGETRTHISPDEYWTGAQLYEAIITAHDRIETLRRAVGEMEALIDGGGDE